MTHRNSVRLLLAALAWGTAVVSYAQFTDSAFDLEHPAVAYSTRPTSDRVAALNERLKSGQTKLAFEQRAGYLKPLLDALNVRVDSQVVVFSKTSLQSEIISPTNPRTIFFNDTVSIAWVRGGFIEVAVQDPQQGAVFYMLQQAWSPQPQLVRTNQCLSCLYAVVAAGVPGLLVRSVPSSGDLKLMPWLGNYVTDHRSPLDERWAGWYVTGRAGSARHLGNALIADKTASDVTVRDADLNVATLASRFNTDAYLSPHSDIVALLTFNHQARMMNLLTRIGWEARVLAYEGRGPDGLRDIAAELVDYLLFADEAPLGGVRGTSGFTESFSAGGPRDRKGRSLRDFDLTQRLFKYPCSYMIYSEAFDQLPATAKQVIYSRLWQVLSGAERSTKYARLSRADRDAIVEILRDTKKDLPESFTPRQSQP